ncbi:MAG: hypothetical protein M3421_07410, partial [Bacteroidota bacterium]|nr:hypothetical protein [Bacteroidota bacterium]
WSKGKILYRILFHTHTHTHTQTGIATEPSVYELLIQEGLTSTYDLHGMHRMFLAMTDNT